jgi:hypothetical protein
MVWPGVYQRLGLSMGDGLAWLLSMAGHGSGLWLVLAMVKG